MKMFNYNYMCNGILSCISIIVITYAFNPEAATGCEQGLDSSGKDNTEEMDTSLGIG